MKAMMRMSCPIDEDISFIILRCVYFISVLNLQCVVVKLTKTFSVSTSVLSIIM